MEAMKHTIEFRRVERDCQRNKDLRAKGERGILYDWEVDIDGEVRAVWKKNGYKPGYTLYDIEGQLIRDSETRRAYKAERQSDMPVWTRQILSDGRIPTLAQIEAARLERVREREDREAKERRQQAVERAREAGPELLAALKAILPLAEFGKNNPTDIPVSAWCAQFRKHISILDGARAAIRKAEGEDPAGLDLLAALGEDL